LALGFYGIPRISVLCSVSWLARGSERLSLTLLFCWQRSLRPRNFKREGDFRDYEEGFLFSNFSTFYVEY